MFRCARDAVGARRRPASWRRVDGLWTIRGPSREIRNLVDKPLPRPRIGGYSSSCSKGPQTESEGVGACIGTVDYGPAVPSGVFMSGATGGTSRDRAIPTSSPRPSAPRTGAIDPVFTDSPQYVHDGLSARLGVPVVVKVETVNPIRSFKGRGTWIAMHGLAGEGSDRPRAARRRGVGRQFRPGRRLRGSGAWRTGRRVLLDAREPRQDRADAGLGRDGHRVRRRLRRRPGASEAYATEHVAELLVDGDDVRISTGAATLALEVTDAVEAGRPAGARRRGRPGRQRRAHQRRRVVAAPCRARVPRWSVVQAEARRRHDPVVGGAGRPIDTDSAATYADGIASRVAIPSAVELMRGRVDDMQHGFGGRAAGRPGRADRRARDHRRGRRSRLVGRAAGGRAPGGPALVIVTGSNA